MIQLLTVCIVVRIMAVTMMIFTLCVTEQGVCVDEIPYFWATKFWNHRQETENI
jgi:hypothetical protein